jgi:hypothetical protein
LEQFDLPDGTIDIGASASIGMVTGPVKIAPLIGLLIAT